MIGEGTRQFDLYDFFSIFLPGAAFLVGLVPFLPQGFSLPTAGILGTLIIGGFVAGRGLHAIRILVERRFRVTSHRDQFIREVIECKTIDEMVVDEFYTTCREEFSDLELPNRDQLDKTNENDLRKLHSLYTLVRSTIHMDARGRSRTFQALVDFHGTLYAASCGVGVIYMCYAIFELIDPADTGAIEFTPFIATLGIHPLILFFAAIMAFIGPFFIFVRIRQTYREVFVDYLMCDFLVLTGDTERREDRRP
jgi:hypothetical protein